jgi:hypothetical protein
MKRERLEARMRFTDITLWESEEREYKRSIRLCGLSPTRLRQRCDSPSLVFNIKYCTLPFNVYGGRPC